MGVFYERDRDPRLHRVQAKELYDNEKQEDDTRETAAEEVLSF